MSFGRFIVRCLWFAAVNSRFLSWLSSGERIFTAMRPRPFEISALLRNEVSMENFSDVEQST